MSSLGGSPRKLVTVASPLSTPQWNLDGAEIAFSVKDTGKNFVEIVSLLTQDTRRIPLPDHAGRDCLDVSWSPDGTTFAYVEAMNRLVEVTRLWAVPSAGGDPFPLTDGFSKVWNPTWSTNAHELFYVSNRGGSMDLWRQRVGPRGKPVGDPEPVTAGFGMLAAVFSADGSKLAYSRGQSVSNIWRVPLLSYRPATWADAEQITSEIAFAEHFDLSPDGKLLVTSSDRGGNMDLWLLPSEGGTMTQLTTDPAPDWMPRWSPDGNEIAFYAYRSGNRDIWVMPAEGGPARQLTTHPGSDIYPDWSPDGKEIAFTRNDADDLWIVDAKGGEPRQITTHPANDYISLWSPDGKSLAFLSTRSGDRRLWRISLEGGEPEPLTPTTARNPVRSSPDGRILYFRRPEDPANVWALSLEDGTEYQVTDLAGRRGSRAHGLAAGSRYLYFNWSENLGDIWVMDVVTDEEE